MKRYLRLLLLTVGSALLTGCTVYAKPTRHTVLLLDRHAPNVVIVQSKPATPRVCQAHGRHWHCQK